MFQETKERRILKSQFKISPVVIAEGLPPALKYNYYRFEKKQHCKRHRAASLFLTSNNMIPVAVDAHGGVFNMTLANDNLVLQLRLLSFTYSRGTKYVVYRD